TRTAVTRRDLAGLRWKCGCCEEWHTGTCLDFSYDAPHDWPKEHDKANRDANLRSSLQRAHPRTFLDEDYCGIDDRDFFVCGIIHLPIIGTTETLRWGVWGSLSRDNFETLMKTNDDPKHTRTACHVFLVEHPDPRVPGYPEPQNVHARPSTGVASAF
ncbi:MAG: DUF2199 domain-containing protein, partial [Candidatus Sulfotelmatobacter sp.]